MTVNSLSCVDQYHIKTSRQTRRRSPFPYVPDVVASVNLAKGVVAVAGVLGLTTAEVLVTQNFTIRGPRVSRSAKHDHSLRQSLVSNEMLLNTERKILLRVLSWQTTNQSP